MLLRHVTLGLALLLLGATAAPASAATTSRAVTETPVAGVPLSVTCGTDPAVLFTGRTGVIRATVRSFVNGTSGRLTTAIVFQGVSGVDADGTVYRISSTSGESVSFQASATAAYRTTRRIHTTLTAVGSGVRYQSHVTVHIVVDPNGETKVEVDRTRRTCDRAQA